MVPPEYSSVIFALFVAFAFSLEDSIPRLVIFWGGCFGLDVFDAGVQRVEFAVGVRVVGVVDFIAHSPSCLCGVNFSIL